MIRQLTVAALAGSAAFFSTAAHADENYFGYSYGAETLPAGGTEAYLWATDRRGKGAGHFDAQDYKFELEHGVTDHFQVSGYANFESHHVRGLEPDFTNVDRDFAFKGLQASFKYAVLSPYKDPVGLAVYFEPGWSRIHNNSGEKGTELELEFKTIVQKNFLEDRLVWATNFTVEPEWEKEVREISPRVTESEWVKELKMEVSTGLAYQFAPGWFGGFEGRYASVYPNWTRDFHRAAYAVSAGPTIHYGGRKWWFTATYLPQLFGSPSPSGSRTFDEYEKREVRLKIGYNF